MSLNIKNEEAHRLASELAQLRGVSTTQAVLDAVRNDLDREKRRTSRQGLAQEILEIGRHCAAHMQPFASEDHADMLYDEKGLPK